MRSRRRCSASRACRKPAAWKSSRPPAQRSPANRGKARRLSAMADVMQTIVVAYDDPGSKTLERAAQLAQALGSNLIVTNVAAAAEGTEVDPAERETRAKLDEAKAELEARGVAADYVLTRGNPGEAVVKLASERGADLIVVGTRRK